MAREEEFDRTVKRDVEARIREGVKAVLEEVLEEEMTEHLAAGYRELTPTRRGELLDSAAVGGEIKALFVGRKELLGIFPQISNEHRELLAVLERHGAPRGACYER